MYTCINTCTSLDGEKASNKLAETPVATVRHSSSLSDSICKNISNTNGWILTSMEQN